MVQLDNMSCDEYHSDVDPEYVPEEELEPRHNNDEKDEIADPLSNIECSNTEKEPHKKWKISETNKAIGPRVVTTSKKTPQKSKKDKTAEGIQEDSVIIPDN